MDKAINQLSQSAILPQAVATAIADLRKDYTLKGMQETDIDRNPFVQFQQWFDQAREAQIPEPNAMTLATTTPDGKPSARIVLLKNFDPRGFVFYTNYNSQKGQELAENPQASLVFWWAELERQVRICGRVEKVSENESDEYFYSRPLNSRLGAWTSNQSEIICDRNVLEQRFEELQHKYKDGNVPRPQHWGGLRVIPTEIEFWQGRPSRLHDRLRYTRLDDNSWVIERLSP
jgi:pyridoxamine 5'-phosphate oxidase